MELDEKIDSLRDEIINKVVEIVRIKSLEGKALPGKPYGEDVAKVLETTLNIAKELGFKTVNLDGFIGYAEYTPEGVAEDADYVGVLGHLDVVPEGDGWTYPPFAAEIHEGRIYGRGTTDDKSPIMASLFSLYAIKELKLPLSKKVRIIFGTNEETGCKEIKYYLSKEKPPVSGFTPDAEYPIIYAEKGITHLQVSKKIDINNQGKIKILTLKGGLAPNMVPNLCTVEITSNHNNYIVNSAKEVAEKTGFDITATEEQGKVLIVSKGKAAHGSLPETGQNAIMQAFQFLGEVDKEYTEVMNFINFFNQYVGMESDGKAFGVGLQDKASGKLSFNVGVVELTDNEIIMKLDVRYPVTYTYDDMMTPFKKRLEKSGIEVKTILHMEPLYFPKDHPLIATLTKIFVKHTGSTAKPLAIGGGTYAKEMPNIVAFGPIFPGKPDLDHQVDEYVEIEDVILNAKIYADAIYELAK